jgi:uncharacterized protein YfkK (UPF0435 family)
MNSNNFVEELISDNLIFFGTSHTQDLDVIHKLIEKIKKFSPNVILIEGGFEKATFDSEEMAIKRGGEMGAVSFFAKNSKITLLPNDPDSTEEINFLSQKFGKDFAFLYFYLRNSSFYKNQKINLDVLNEIKNTAKWENFDFSIQNIKNIFLNVINEPFIQDKDYSNYFNPTLSFNKLNLATRELNKFRDDFMISKLKSLIRNKDNICIVKGSYHLIKTKKAIKELIK